MALMPMEMEELTEVITSEFTVDTTYVNGFSAYKSGNIIFIALEIKANTPSATNVVTIPAKYKPITDTLWFGAFPNNNTTPIAVRVRSGSTYNDITTFGTSSNPTRSAIIYPYK